MDRTLQQVDAGEIQYRFRLIKDPKELRDDLDDLLTEKVSYPLPEEEKALQQAKDELGTVDDETEIVSEDMENVTDEPEVVNGEVAGKVDELEAIRTLEMIESKKRPATNEEQEVLSKYVGWGGLADA